MKDRVIRKSLVICIIILFLGTSVIPIISGYNKDFSHVSINYKYIKKMGTKDVIDQIDQSQTIIGIHGQSIRDNLWGAQGFVPTLNVLTRVYLVMYKKFNPPNDVIISIRDALPGPDLISISIPKNQIPTYPDKDWVEANFDDITVVPQKSYYIVVRTIGGDTLNHYCWCASGGDPYPAGNPWYSEDYGKSWGKVGGVDRCFITYGRNNTPPDAPTIKGPTVVRPGTYNWTFQAFDSDDGYVSYEIIWGDGTPTYYIDWVPTKYPVKVSHTYTAVGTVTISARAKDIHEAVGDWEYLSVEISRSKQKFAPLLLWFLDWFPLLERLFNILRWNIE